MKDSVDYQVELEGVAVLTIRRPEARNALDWAAQEQFAAAVEMAASDPSLRVLIITGAGDQAFASGGDLKELIHYPDPESGERLSRVLSGALDRLTRLPLPVIAAVNGDAVGGGCEIMTACDLRLAAENATFRFAQIHVGLTTGWGGTARLIHLVGAGRAMELLLTGRKFGADEAVAIGFVNRLAKASQVQARALQWAEELRALPHEALAACKRLAWATADLTLEEAYRLETKLFAGIWPTADHLEAMAAFNEKRRPHFGDWRGAGSLQPK